MTRAIKFNASCSPDFRDLVDKLLQREPAYRIPLIKVFDHPWVRAFEIKYNLKKDVNVKQMPPQKGGHQRKHSPVRPLESN
mmetsp:Transcript_28034/g.27056  ORF Transcript_28034/g.27056 Transcript_28034/m.27056 type:complete len:81 (+) Transcript_28034:478-720(+)